MKKFLFLIVSLTLFYTNLFSQGKTIIIKQKDVPVKITKYNATYQRADTYNNEGIKYELDYQNIYIKNIIAVEFGFIAFDVWNEYMNKMVGLTIEVLKC